MADTVQVLREKIAREIADNIAVDRQPIDVALITADAIPEIRDALGPIYILGEATEESYNWPGKPDGIRRIKPPNA